DRQARLDLPGNHAAGDVVVDARVEGRQLVAERAVATLEADLHAGGALRVQLRVADVVVAVAARGVLEALAQVWRAVGLAEVGVGVEGVGQRPHHAERPGNVVVAALQTLGLRHGAAALLGGITLDPVVAQAEGDLGDAKAERVLYKQAGGGDLAVLEGVVEHAYPGGRQVAFRI